MSEVINFVKIAIEKGKEIRIPPTKSFNRVVDVTKDTDLEEIKSYIFEFAHEVVKVDLYTESEFVAFIYMDKETKKPYQKFEMDYTSFHQMIYCFQEIEKRIISDTGKPE